MKKIFEVVLLEDAEMGNFGSESDAIFVMEVVVLLRIRNLIGFFVVIDVKGTEIASISKDFRTLMYIHSLSTQMQQFINLCRKR